MKTRVFIGSSREGLPLAHAAQENLDNDAEVTAWDQDVFALSRSTLDSLVAALDKYDCGVFIFSPDDIARIRGEEHQVARDNVVFELGLFIGHLGKDRCFVLLPRDTEDLHLPTDLLGMTPATYDPNRTDHNLAAALGPACSKVKKAMHSLGIMPEPKHSTEQKSPPAKAYDDNDIISILQAWLGKSPAGSTALIVYADVDRQLCLPSGSTEKHIEMAGRRYHLVTERKGTATIMFKYAPPSVPDPWRAF